MDKKVKKLKDMQKLVRKLNKIDNNNDDRTYAVCSDLILKLTDIFFTKTE